MTLRPGEDHLAAAIQRLKQRPHTPPPPQGLPGDLYDRLESALLICAPADCAPLFVDERLAPWRDAITDTPEERVDTLIAHLDDQQNTHGDNALILFLNVLGEHIDPGNALHTQLTQLAADLDHALTARLV